MYISEFWSYLIIITSYLSQQRQCSLLTFHLLTFSSKSLGQWQPNMVGIFIGWFSTVCFLIENTSDQDSHEHRNKSKQKKLFSVSGLKIFGGRVGTFCMHTVIMSVYWGNVNDKALDIAMSKVLTLFYHLKILKWKIIKQCYLFVSILCLLVLSVIGTVPKH